MFPRLTFIHSAHHVQMEIESESEWVSCMVMYLPDRYSKRDILY